MREAGLVLRHLARVEDGRGSVGLKAIPAADPVASEEELSLVAPDSDSPDAVPSSEPQSSAGDKQSVSSDESALDTEDADLEGLGMVLGEEKHEKETG